MEETRRISEFFLVSINLLTLLEMATNSRPTFLLVEVDNFDRFGTPQGLP